MADDKIKHQHSPNDIIIKDQDGSYKILRDGKFVPLDQAEAKQHALESKTSAKPAPPVSAAVKPPAPPTPKPQPAAPTRTVPVKAAMPATPAPRPTPVTQPQRVAPPTKPVSAPRQEDKTALEAEQILKKTGLTFASGEVRSRVTGVLVSHLKGIRKPFETKLFLVKGVREGGAGLTEQEAEIVLMATSGYKVLANAADKPEPPAQAKRPSAIPMGKELMPMPQMEVSQPADAKPMFPPLEASKAVGPAFAPKPSLADVQKPMRSLGGPVDQLAFDLMTWRRLGQDPKDRIKKIEAQLDILEQDGYPERLKGLLAWQNSEVMRKYIEAGKKSIETSASIQDVLGAGSDTGLSHLEWEAIADLNNRIRP